MYPLLDSFHPGFSAAVSHNNNNNTTTIPREELEELQNEAITVGKKTRISEKH